MKERELKITKLAILACAGLTFSASAQDYDLVILDGRVMDPETMFDAVANVAIKGGRIAAIAKEDCPIHGILASRAVVHAHQHDPRGGLAPLLAERPGG